jgi:hypothetical protein
VRQTYGDVSVRPYPPNLNGALELCFDEELRVKNLRGGVKGKQTKGRLQVRRATKGVSVKNKRAFEVLDESGRTTRAERQLQQD